MHYPNEMVETIKGTLDYNPVFHGNYCWTFISEKGKIILSHDIMKILDLKPEMKLLSIQSSNIAFTMGSKGPLLEKAENYNGEILSF